MKRALTVLLFAVSLSLVSCGGSQDTSTTTTEKSEDGADEEEVDPKGKKWGGWRWKGKRNNCFFVHDNQCFAKLKKACKRAKCGKRECIHDDSAPAKVSCKKK